MSGCGVTRTGGTAEKALSVSEPASHTAAMSRSGRRARSEPTFAAVVDDLQRRPPAPTPDDRSRLRSPDGRVFFPSVDELSPAEAAAMVAAGATVAWDSCGCQGYCGMEWFPATDNARFLRAGPPEFVPRSRKVPHADGHLSAWRTDDGQVLVLATREVRWGGLMF